MLCDFYSCFPFLFGILHVSSVFAMTDSCDIFCRIGQTYTAEC